MEIERLLGSLSDRIGGDATVRKVYGEPVQHGDRVVIPVARIGYGFGGGLGSDAAADESDESGRTGGGGGGGMGAAPAGALEITSEGTRFIEFGAGKKAAAAVLIGIAVGFLIGRLGKR